MGREHEPDTVWRAQELYCADRLPMREVAGICGVAESTLWRWAEKYGWADKREEIARAQADIRADFILSRSAILKAFLTDKDPMQGFAVAKLEELALKMSEVARKGQEQFGEAARAAREIKTPGDAAAALEEAVWRKVSAMLADPDQIRDVGKLKPALEAIAQLKAQAGTGAKVSKGLTKETVATIMEGL